MKLPLCVLLLSIAACGGSKPAGTTTTRPAPRPLYDRIGGMDAINGIVKDFVEERVKKDDRISARFTNTDTTHFEEMLADQICEVTGGPCKYIGKTMQEAHAGLGIGDAELRALVEDLEATLVKFEVPKAEQDELIAILAKLHDQIVETK
jgi:hemoglobin